MVRGMDAMLDFGKGLGILAALFGGMLLTTYLLLARLTPWLASLHGRDDLGDPDGAEEFARVTWLDPRRRVN